MEKEQVSCGMNMENWVTQFLTIEITQYLKMEGGEEEERLCTASGKRMNEEKKNFKGIKGEIPVCKL